MVLARIFPVQYAVFSWLGCFMLYASRSMVSLKPHVNLDISSSGRGLDPILKPYLCKYRKSCIFDALHTFKYFQ